MKKYITHTYELQSRALHMGPEPMTSSEMMKALSAGDSATLKCCCAKHSHRFVTVGSWSVSAITHTSFSQVHGVFRNKV